MRSRERQLHQRLAAELTRFGSNTPLPGIQNAAARDVLVNQMVDSIRRIRFVEVVAGRRISLLRADPSSELFDPVRAAILALQSDEFDEACWFVFLFVHFGKHGRTGWRLARDVFGRLGRGHPWTWARVRAHPTLFRNWLHDNYRTLRGSDGIKRHFGNHRKYESLDAWSDNGTGAVVQSYVQWVGVSHRQRFEEAIQAANENPEAAFDLLYRSMRAVRRFGRTARFDYLTMIGKIGLAAISPGRSYLDGSTGPLRGARLLFGGSDRSRLTAKDLETRLARLDQHLRVGKQVLEDSLCNWQKSPLAFNRFYG